MQYTAVLSPALSLFYVPCHHILQPFSQFPRVSTDPHSFCFQTPSLSFSILFNSIRISPQIFPRRFSFTEPLSSPRVGRMAKWQNGKMRKKRKYKYRSNNHSALVEMVDGRKVEIKKNILRIIS